MGTRNLTMVVLDGEYKVAQYGQWDGYPVGQGSTICEFLQSGFDLDKFKQVIRECKYISQEDVSKKLEECGAESGAEWVSMDVSRKFTEKYPHLSRDTGGDILNRIYKHGARELQNMLSFASDSLFCEWAYVIDLDNEILEVYKGFNQEPLNTSERFFIMSGLEVNKKYAPVTLIKKYKFSEATVQAMTDLENELNEEEEEDE